MPELEMSVPSGSMPIPWYTVTMFSHRAFSVAGPAACNHRRRKGSVVGGHHGECGTGAYNGGLEAEPLAGPRGKAPGQRVTGSGGEAPLKLKAFWSLDVQRSRQI